MILAIAFAFLLAAGSSPTASASSPASPTASPTASADADPPVPVTVSDFYPEDSNLSDCVGLVERPGCGSESRGGGRQTAVFVLLFVGLGVIIWRITVGVRKNRASVDA